MRLFAAMILITVLYLPTVSAKNYLKAYPQATAGQQRWLVQLPKIDDEKSCKVEIIVGKLLMLDPKNLYFLSGHIERKILKGWGFSYYVVKKIGPLVGTRMAISHNTAKIKRFIPLGGVPYLIPYNSKLPIVIYLPQGAEARYRIWRAGKIEKMTTHPKLTK